MAHKFLNTEQPQRGDINIAWGIAPGVNYADKRIIRIRSPSFSLAGVRLAGL